MFSRSIITNVHGVKHIVFALNVLLQSFKARDQELEFRNTFNSRGKVKHTEECLEWKRVCCSN